MSDEPPTPGAAVSPADELASAGVPGVTIAWVDNNGIQLSTW